KERFLVREQRFTAPQSHPPGGHVAEFRISVSSERRFGPMAAAAACLEGEFKLGGRDVVAHGAAHFDEQFQSAGGGCSPLNVELQPVAFNRMGAEMRLVGIALEETRVERDPVVAVEKMRKNLDHFRLARTARGAQAGQYQDVYQAHEMTLSQRRRETQG